VKGHLRREEHDPGVVFFVSGVVEGGGDTPDAKNATLGSRSSRLGGRG